MMLSLEQFAEEVLEMPLDALQRAVLRNPDQPLTLIFGRKR